MFQWHKKWLLNFDSDGFLKSTEETDDCPYHDYFETKKLPANVDTDDKYHS